MLTELYDRTHGFLNPTIVETAAAFPVSFSAIAEMFEGLRRDSTPQKMNYVRGYVDGREDYSLGEQFLAATNDFTCSLHALGDAIKVSFGGETPALGPHSGMIVNGGLQWSEWSFGLASPFWSVTAPTLQDRYVRPDLRGQPATKCRSAAVSFCQLTTTMWAEAQRE